MNTDKRLMSVRIFPDDSVNDGRDGSKKGKMDKKGQKGSEEWEIAFPSPFPIPHSLLAFFTLFALFVSPGFHH
jgi:hypothetical protein